MNIHSTATKDCYGHPQLKIAKPRYTGYQKTTNVTHIGCMTILNCYKGDDRLQRILLSPFDRRPALHTEVASSILERVQMMLNQTLLMRLLPAFPADDRTAHRLMSDVHDIYEHVLSLHRTRQDVDLSSTTSSVTLPSRPLDTLQKS